MMSFSDPERLRNRLIEGISEFMSQLISSSVQHTRAGGGGGAVSTTNYNQEENERESLVTKLVHTVFECKHLFKEDDDGATNA